MTQQITGRVAAHAFYTLAAQAENLAALGFGRNPDFCMTIKRGNFDFATQRGGRKADGHFAMQVVMIALENAVLRQMDDYVQVSGRPTIDPGFAFAG